MDSVRMSRPCGSALTKIPQAYANLSQSDSKDSSYSSSGAQLELCFNGINIQNEGHMFKLRVGLILFLDERGESGISRTTLSEIIHLFLLLHMRNKNVPELINDVLEASARPSVVFDCRLLRAN